MHLMAIAVEPVPASPRQGEGIKRSHFVAGSARIAVLPAATAADLGGFVRGAAKPGARIITDGLKSYDGLADSFRHYSIVQDGGKKRRCRAALRPCPVQQREDLAQRHLPRRQRQASATLCPRVELPLQSPPTHRRSDRFPAPPSGHPANHHLPPARRGRSNQRSLPALTG